MKIKFDLLLYWIFTPLILLSLGCSTSSKSSKPHNREQLTIAVNNVSLIGSQKKAQLNVYVYDEAYNSIHFKRVLSEAGRVELKVPKANTNKTFIRILQFNPTEDSIHYSAYYNGVTVNNINLKLKSGFGPNTASILNLPSNADKLIVKQNDLITDIRNIDQSDYNKDRHVIDHIQYGEQKITALLYDGNKLLYEESKTINTRKGKTLKTEIVLNEDEEVLFRIGFPNYLGNKKKNELAYLSKVTVPYGYSSKIEDSKVIAPEFIKEKYQVISPTYEVKAIDKNQNVLNHINFERGFARLAFKIDPTILDVFDFNTDFTGFSWNENTNEWELVASTIYNEKSGEISVFTKHLSTFVLTALPASNTNVHDYPHCITADFPYGIGGNGSTEFTIIEPYFKYYQDRNYYIVPLNQSAENTRTFNELGFHRAMGIATCNGGSACGPTNAHKKYNGDDYIKFEAHKDIDVYLMYDSRGGASYDDKSNDAPWINDIGFTATDYYIETTDAVGLYGIYKKTYLKNDTVRLHGNTKGGTDPKIGTNYWVIMKEAGNLSPTDASQLCENNPPSDPPPYIENAIAIGGNNKVTISWDNPTYSNFEGVVIRKSTTTPPLTLAEGIEPQGTVVDTETYIDNDVTNGTTYYYSIFALDNNYNYGNVFILKATSGNDSDNDGLSDTYEDTAKYANNAVTDKNKSDTDNDGWDDLKEVLAGFDPTVPFIDVEQDSVYAGKDSSTCQNNIQLKAKYYSVGKGRWEVIQGNAYMALPNNFNSAALNLDIGDNIFRWIVSNGPYEKYDDVLIRRESNTVIPTFSIGDTSICGDTLSLSANNTGFPSYWTFSDTSTFLDSNANNIRLREITAGTNYLKWNIDHPACPSLSDSIRITSYNPDYIANAGEDIFTKQNSVQLEANMPSNTLGSWRKISGSGTLVDLNNPKTNLNGILAGIHEYEWTLDNDLCGITKDTLKIIFDNVAPQINSFQLSANHIMGSIAVSLDIDASDNVGIETWVIKEVHRQSNTVNTYTTKLKPNFYNLQHAEDGNYRLYLSAIDAAGNRFDYNSPVSTVLENRLPTKITTIADKSTPIEQVAISGNYICWIENDTINSLMLYDGNKAINISISSKIEPYRIWKMVGNNILFSARNPTNKEDSTNSLYYYNGNSILDLKQNKNHQISHIYCSDMHVTWFEKIDSIKYTGVIYFNLGEYYKGYYFDGKEVSNIPDRFGRIDQYSFNRTQPYPKVRSPIHEKLIDNTKKQIRQAINNMNPRDTNRSIYKKYETLLFKLTDRKNLSTLGKNSNTGVVWKNNDFIENFNGNLSFYQEPEKAYWFTYKWYSNKAIAWILIPDEVNIPLTLQYKLYGNKKIIDITTMQRAVQRGGRHMVNTISISGKNLAFIKGKYEDEQIYFFDGSNTYQISKNGSNTSPSISGNNIVWVKTTRNDGGIKIRRRIMLATPP